MSKIRIVWKQGGSIYSGQRAISQIRKLAVNAGIPLAVSGPHWKNAMAIEKQLRHLAYINRSTRLFVYREPRHVNAKNSRYKQTLRTLGIAPLPLDYPRTPRRVLGGGPGIKRTKLASRTVRLLEQELFRIGEDGF